MLLWNYENYHEDDGDDDDNDDHDDDHDHDNFMLTKLVGWSRGGRISVVRFNASPSPYIASPYCDEDDDDDDVDDYRYAENEHKDADVNLTRPKLVVRSAGN